MRPILFELFSVPFVSWYVFFALGALAALAVGRSIVAARNPELLGHFFMLFSISYVAGWLGARLLGVVTEEPLATSPLTFLFGLLSFGPMSFWGGVTFATLCALAYCSLKRLPAWPLLDAAAPALLVGMALGRVGCFLNGCDFGRPIPASWGEPWWAPVVLALEDNVPRYPTQLEESLFSAIIGFLGYRFLVSQSRRVPVSGVTGLALFAAAAAHRGLNEFWRGDERPYPQGSSLSWLQWVALLFSLVCLYLAWKRTRAPKSSSPNSGDL